MFKDIKNDIEALERQLTAPRFDVDKALREIEFLAWAFLLATFALKIFGFDIGTPSIENERLLAVIRFVDSNNMVRVLTNTFLGVVTFNLIWLSVEKARTFRVFSINIIVIFFQLMLNFSYQYNMTLGFYYVLCFSPYIIFLLITKSIKLALFILIFDTAFQSISLFAKFSYKDILDNSVSVLIVSNIDYLLMWVICLIKTKRGVKWQFSFNLGLASLTNKLRVSKNWLKGLTTTLKAVPTQLKSKSLKGWFVHLKARLKIFVRCELRLKFQYRVAPIVIIFGIYFGYAYFVDKLLQAVFLYIAYLHLRKLFPKHFHADYIPNIKKNYISITCICLSSLMLCTALYNVIGGGLSVISSIIVAFVVDWLLYVIRDWLDRLASDPVVMDLLKWFNKEERLKKKCADINMSALLTEICIDWKINKLSRQQQADKYGYALNTIRKYRNDIENLLKTK